MKCIGTHLKMYNIKATFINSRLMTHLVHGDHFDHGDHSPQPAF